MKAFFVLCLAVAVSAEADPQLLLNSPYTFGVSPFYSSFYHSPLVKAVEYKKPEEMEKVELKTIMPTTYAYSPYTYGMFGHSIIPRYYAKSAEGVEHVVAKRDAEADPFLLYGAGFYRPYAATFAPYTTAYTAAYTAPYTYAYAPYTYSMIPRYYAKSAENVEHVVAKREAEAEADPFFLYNTYSYAPAATYATSAYAYSAAAYPYTYRTYSPYVYNAFPRAFGYYY